MFGPGAAPGVYYRPPLRYPDDTQRYCTLTPLSDKEPAAQYAEYDECCHYYPHYPSLKPLEPGKQDPEPCYRPCPSPEPFRRGRPGPPFVSTSGSFDDEFPPISAAAPARLFNAKVVSGGPGGRYRSMPPGPNNWKMELQWEPVEGASSNFTTDPEAALRTVAAKFATAWLGGGFEGGVFYASIPLSARTPPRAIPRSEFFWQEPYHTPFPDTSPGLEDAVVREMLLRMSVAYAA